MNIVCLPYSHIFKARYWRVANYLALLFAFQITAYAQQEVIEKLSDPLESLAGRQSLESIYLQTSKGIYETEEDLWFKAYVLDSKTLQPSLRSKILFLRLVHDESNEPVWQEKYEIESGFVNGNLYLPDSLKAGGYNLTAYTAHSFYNTSQKLHAVRRLKIVKLIEQNSPPSQARRDSVLEFNTFPEGGNLVSGILNRLAFKAVNVSGEPQFVSGILYENNAPLLEFKSVHAGMGSLEFTPDVNNQYHIELTQPAVGTKYAVPPIKHSGVGLRLAEVGEGFLMFDISASAGYPKNNLYFRLQMRGTVYKMATAVAGSNLMIKVPVHDLPQGIAEVTLYNQDMMPICERLVYINQDRRLNIHTAVAEQYKTRDKVAVEISVTDQNGKPVVAHLGLSIYDFIYQNIQDTKNILTHYHLSTQLKGRVYNPGYYFDSKNEDRAVALNLLMLTQGWRKYHWNESNLAQAAVNESLLSDEIKGTITPRKRSKQPLDQLALMAYTPENDQYQELITVSSSGQFLVEPEQLKIGAGDYTYLRLLLPPNSGFGIKLEDSSFGIIDSLVQSIELRYPVPPSNYAYDFVKPFDIDTDVVLLDEVTVKAKNKPVKRDKYLATLDSIAKLELTTDYVCEFSDILNCPTHPRSEKSRMPVEGAIYLDFYVLTDQGWVQGIPKDNRPFKNPPLPPYRYSVLSDDYLLRRYNMVRTKGFHGKKEFYKPTYDDNTVDDPVADYRNTLIWDPTIIADRDGKARVEFYTSDLDTSFFGVIEGVSGRGDLGHNTFEFEVVDDSD